MGLGDAHLTSERIRTTGDLLLDDPAASHAYAWLFHNGPATLGEYVTAAGANERAARLAINRLVAHGIVAETAAGYAADAIRERVGDVHVTPGVAAVLAIQVENYDARTFVQRHGSRTLAEAVRYWPLVDDGAITSRRAGEELDIGEQEGVTAMNFVRGVADHIAADPEFADVPTPEVSPIFP